MTDKRTSKEIAQSQSDLLDRARTKAAELREIVDEVLSRES